MDYDLYALAALSAAIIKTAMHDYQRGYRCDKYPPADRFLRALGFTLPADGAIEMNAKWATP